MSDHVVTTLQLIGKGGWSYDVTVREASGLVVGSIVVGSSLPWSPGVITIGEERYTARMGAWRRSTWRPWFLMKYGDEVIAEAEQPHVFSSTITFDYSGARYELRDKRRWLIFSDGISLVRQGTTVGSIRPRAAKLPGSVPAQIQYFIIWLALVRWKFSG